MADLSGRDGFLAICVGMSSAGNVGRSGTGTDGFSLCPPSLEIISTREKCITVKHFIFARLKFRESRIQAIREHLIFANRGHSELSKTFYGLKIGA